MNEQMNLLTGHFWEDCYGLHSLTNSIKALKDQQISILTVNF